MAAHARRQPIRGPRRRQRDGVLGGQDARQLGGANAGAGHRASDDVVDDKENTTHSPPMVYLRKPWSQRIKRMKYPLSYALISALSRAISCSFAARSATSC